jgi:exodeoxyribonuclease-3
MSKVKILSWNLNGIRTRFKNKQLEAIFEKDPDIMVFQETKANYEQLDDKLKTIPNYNSYFSKDLESRTGGVATYSKLKAKTVRKFFSKNESKFLGKILNIEYDEFRLINIQAPTGAKDFQEKEEFYNSLTEYLKQIASEKVIIAGDFNIAIDEEAISEEELKKATKFEEEKEIINKILAIGYEDGYKIANGDKKEYSYFKSAQAKEKGSGSRIGLFLVSNSLKDAVKASTIDSNIEGAKHLAIELEIDI